MASSHVAGAEWLSFPRRRQQCAETGEAVGGHQSQRDELGQSRLNDLGTQLAQRKQELTFTSTPTFTSALSTAPTATSGGRLLDLTKEELYEKAKEAGIDGRSSMTKSQLADALQRQG